MPSTSRRYPGTLVLGLILVIYAGSRTLEIAGTAVPRTVVVAFDVLSTTTFALVDGARHYGLRGILVFAGICVLVGNLIENLGVATGFPFGRYYFAELMGPRLLHVPLLLGLAYVGMAYVSWTLARLIVGIAPESSSGMRIVAIPLMASFIMVAWDLAQDPVWSTVLHGWIWLDGGPWFGVPISNYLGWYATVFVIDLLFALYLRRKPHGQTTVHATSTWPAILFYALCAMGNVLQTIPRAMPEVVRDPAGRSWNVAYVTGASALVSIFVMGAFAVLACVRLAVQKNTAKD